MEPSHVYLCYLLATGRIVRDPDEGEPCALPRPETTQPPKNCPVVEAKTATVPVRTKSRCPQCSLMTEVRTGEAWAKCLHCGRTFQPLV